MKYARFSSVSLFFLLIFNPIFANSSATLPEKAGDLQRMDPRHAAAADLAVAAVNGEKITMAELMETMHTVTMQKYGRAEITESLAERIKKEALDRLITEEVITQRIREKQIIVPTEEVETHLARLKEQLGSQEKFQEHLAQKNLTEPGLRERIRNFLRVEKLIKEEVEEKIRVEEDDLKKAYQLNLNQFTQTEKVEATDIVFFLDPTSTEHQQRAQSTYKRLIGELEGKPEALPQNSSLVVRDNLTLNEESAPGLYRRAKTMQPGEITPPFVVDGTLHILKLHNYRPKVVKSLSEVRDFLEKKLRENFKKAELKSWMAELKAAAEIEVYDTKVE